MSRIRAGGYISRVLFNNGSFVDFRPNDIVVFVGPNNVGKSQTLWDLYESCSEKRKLIIIDDIEITKYDQSIVALLKEIAALDTDRRDVTYGIMDFNSAINEQTDQVFQSEKSLVDFAIYSLLTWKQGEDYISVFRLIIQTKMRLKRIPFNMLLMIRDIESGLQTNLKKPLGSS